MIALLLGGALALLDSLYQTGDYESVVRQAPVFLADSCRSRDDSVAVLRLQASAEVALGRNRVAAGLFRQALALQPDLELDPELTSPKIRAVFDAVKSEIRAQPETPARHDTVVVRKPVSLAVIVPGLAQLRQRQTVKGTALLGAGVLSAAGLVTSVIGCEQAHRQYLAADRPADIAQRYQTLNGWYHARTVFITSSAAIWLYSLVDALVRP